MSNIESTKSAASIDAAAAGSSAPSAAPRQLPDSDAVVRFQNELARPSSMSQPAPSKDESFADLFRFEKQTGSASAAVPNDMPPPQRFDRGARDALTPGLNVPSQGSDAALEPMTNEDLARLQALAQKRESAGKDALTPGQGAPQQDDAGLAPLSSEELARIAALARGEAAPASVGGATGIFPSSSVQQAASGGVPSNEALQALVSKILVSSPEAGSATVRLTLAGHVLGGTEVTIARGADGALAVKLAAGDPAAFQTLVAGRDDLARLLSAGERMPVNIQIESERDARDDEQSRKGRHKDASEDSEP